MSIRILIDIYLKIQSFTDFHQMASFYACHHENCDSKHLKIFKTVASLQNHLIHKHLKVLCSICQNFFDRHSLKAHNNVHHKGISLQKCQYCDKYFGGKKRSLRRHLKTCTIAISSGHFNAKTDIDFCHKYFFDKKDIEQNGSSNNKRDMSTSLNCPIPMLGYRKSTPPRYRNVGFLNKKKLEIVNFF